MEQSSNFSKSKISCIVGAAVLESIPNVCDRSGTGQKHVLGLGCFAKAGGCAELFLWVTAPAGGGCQTLYTNSLLKEWAHDSGYATQNTPFPSTL